jgi:thiol-disulfide isomerase/thioredoxin
VTLIDLWATWCPPCLVERPVLVEALAKWKARGFDIVSIGLDDSAAVERRFLEARPELSWRHAVAASPDGRLRRETADRFGVLGIPRWILVDSTGRVLEEQVLHLDSLLARHLGPP